MKLTKDQIIGALPRLSQRDLIAIKTVTGALLQQTGVSTQNNAASPQAWLFTALSGVLNAGHRAPGNVKGFDKNAKAFLAFIEGHFTESLHNKVEGLAVMTGMLQLLVSDLQVQHIPVTFNTMAAHLPRIPEVFERAFPGYIDSGLAHIWLKRG